MESDPIYLLRLLQLASPALPVGGFSYSEGIEAAVAHQLVRDEASAQTWLVDRLHLVQSRSELPVIAQAIPAWQRHDEKQLKNLKKKFLIMLQQLLPFKSVVMLSED